MGFRTYDPGLNQFLSRDMYNGALADMGLSTDPFTGNRYTFAAGNPVTNIELDGHMFPGGAQCGILASNPCNPTPASASSGSGPSGGGSPSNSYTCARFGLGCTGGSTNASTPAASSAWIHRQFWPELENSLTKVPSDLG